MFGMRGYQVKIRPPVKEYDPFVIAEKINDYWVKTYSYTRTKNSRIGQKKYFFVDGPPFTTGNLNIGMARNKILKDSHIRFMKSQGFDVIDTPGFDMHGLPIEVKVEESLGISFKRQIEELGVEKFVTTCMDYANESQNALTAQFKALGIWLDWDNPYLTAESSYIESVWWSLKEAHKKNYLEKQKQVTAWCPRCESPLAQGEVSYKEKIGHSVYFKIPIKGRRDEYIIVWTTTPWTFAGCLAIAVHPDLTYARVAIRQGGRKSTIIVLESRVEEIASISGIEAYEIVESLKGSKLENLGFFHPLMADIPFHKTAVGDRCHKILALDSVHDSHTGCVYISPGLGSTDARIGMKYSLPHFSPVGERGIFTTEVGIKYAGQNAEEASNAILADMKALRFVLFESMIPHKFGHCWRCESPIINRATEQWFLKSNELKETMLKTIKGVSWTPDNFGTTRQNEWIMKANDWCISRQRFWGTPLPVWECIADVCGHVEVVGSLKELEDANGYKEGMNLHRPWIDKVSLECPKCGGLMKRVPDIVDVWFDSSVASWGQLGYPRKKNAFKELWPGDWISEGQDQSKGWFYNQIFTGTMLFNKVPFKKVLAHGLITSEIESSKNGKMTQTDTKAALELHGADALRLYLLGQDPSENLIFNMKDVKKAHSVLNLLWNCYVFSASYMSMDHWDPKEKSFAKIKSDLKQEDLWILSRIESLTHDVKKNMESMKLHIACNLIETFILDDFSRWYVKLIRERLWKEGLSPDKEAAFTTLKEVLTRISILSSPFTPYISETIYQEMDAEELSVSMVTWPDVDATRLAEGMERSMNQARTIVRTSQKFRQELGLNLRWPIKKMTISASKEDVATAVNMFSGIIKVQANVKELEIVPENQEWAGQELIVVPNPDVIGKSYKQRESKIARMLKVLPAKDIKSKIEAGEYHLGIEGELIKILPEMVKFETKLPEGVVSINFNDGVLYLDTNMEDELLAEGFAREIMRRIQQMRKELGLDPEEFIKMKVKMEDSLLDLLDKWLEKIADNTRASQMEIVEEIEDEDYIVEWPIKEETVTIGITSLNIKKAMNEFTVLKDVDNELALAIVEFGILSAQDFLQVDRDELLKIPGMNHSKLRKIKENLELPPERRSVDEESICPLCHGHVDPGSAACQRCGKDLIGGEDLIVEITRTIKAEEEYDYPTEPVREKVKIEKRKKPAIESPPQPEDEIIKMASKDRESAQPEDSIASEIMDSIREDEITKPSESPRWTPEKPMASYLEPPKKDEEPDDDSFKIESTIIPHDTSPKESQTIYTPEPPEAPLKPELVSEDKSDIIPRPMSQVSEPVPEMIPEQPPASPALTPSQEPAEENQLESNQDNKTDIIDSEFDKSISIIAETFDIKHSAAKTLYSNGFTSVESLTKASEEELRGIKGIGKITARRIVQKSASDETKMCSLCNAIVPVNSGVCTRCGVKFSSGDEEETRSAEKHIATMDMLEKKLKKKPSDAALLYSKILTLKDAGKNEEALVVLNEAMEISPDDSKLQDLKKELDVEEEELEQYRTPKPIKESIPVREPAPAWKPEPVRESEAVPESVQARKPEPVREPDYIRETAQVHDSEPIQESEPVRETDHTREITQVQKQEPVRKPASVFKPEPIREPALEQPPTQIESATEPEKVASTESIVIYQEQLPAVLVKHEEEIELVQELTAHPEPEVPQEVLPVEDSTVVSLESGPVEPEFIEPVPVEQTPIEPSPQETFKPEALVEPNDGDIKLKASFTYLIPEERSVRSYQLFKMSLNRGMPGYCVTRTFPEKVRERYELGNIPILWLSNVAKEEAVRPKDLEKLSLSLEEFLGKEGGIILLDGIEYLITNNNFITVLKLIQSLRDQVAINRSILLLSINPSTMDSHQINLLKREVDSVIE
jgi:isoleucyl-tRNA synthetase